MARPQIVEALESLARQRRPDANRRRLLAKAVRLRPTIAPRVADAVGRCVEALDITGDVELYVYPDEVVAAACFAPERERLMIMLSSAAVDRLARDELTYVVGHELGHVSCDHLGLPVQALAESRLHADTVLELHGWARAAEVSADRAGLLCTQRLDIAAAVMFKAASGLREIDGAAALDELSAQYEEFAGALSRRNEDLGTTADLHPLLPIRARALTLFADSEVMGGPLSRDDLEQQTEDCLALMEPQYLSGTGDDAKAMRRLMFAAGIAIADAHDGIAASEVEALEKLLDESVDHRLLDTKAIRDDIGSRIGRVLEAGVSMRVRSQVVRDLCLISLADRDVADAERALLYEIAEGLGVTTAAVDAELDGSHDLD